MTAIEKFYSLDSLVSVDIIIPEGDWNALRQAKPRWEWRQWAPVDDIVDKVRKYDWFKASSVTISGPKTSKRTFEGVAIIKKSFAGSEHKVKPSLKVDFARSKTSTGNIDKEKAKQNAKDALALIGTSRLVLNNCKQDESYIRQPLGYEIYRQGGIPYARCNLAKVTVNGKSVGIYVNLEPIESAYLLRNFKNDKGNIYETEAYYDLDLENFDNGKKYDMDGFSPFDDEKDLEIAIEQANEGLEKAKKVFDIPQVTRVLAMQAITKHWDGYPNNTFHYNDVVPVQNPTVANVKFKMIPSGIDCIYSLDPSKKWEVKPEGLLSRLILDDPAARAQLKTTLGECARIFQQNLPANLKLIDTLADLIKTANVADPDKLEKKIDVPKEIAMLKDQIGKASQGIVGIAL